MFWIWSTTFSYWNEFWCINDKINNENFMRTFSTFRCFSGRSQSTMVLHTVQTSKSNSLEIHSLLRSFSTSLSSTCSSPGNILAKLCCFSIHTLSSMFSWVNILTALLSVVSMCLTVRNVMNDNANALFQFDVSPPFPLHSNVSRWN